MENQVDEIKSKIDIVSIIGERVELKKAGSNYKGLCPFHNEKTPSFMVSADLQIFKCFGCQKSGDVITFLEEYEGMEFYEALKVLAQKAGIKLKPMGNSQKGFKDRFFEVNSIVSDFYHYVLLKHPSGKKALEYLLKSRKLNSELIERFKVGFCPDVPLALNNYVIERKKVSLKELSNVGITYTYQGRSYDRFRGRVVFPLYDHRGNIVGFAGRILPGNSNKDLAKYINTPETPVYKKSEILYGLNESRSDIKKLGYSVVVEGELDMISCFKAGIKNVVAIKGSALTQEQAKLLSRFAKVVVLALDTDFAGNEAAKRGIFIAESEGIQVKVAKIVGYKDPDEAAQADPEKLKEFIENAVGIWDFLIDFTFSKYKTLGGEQKEKIGKELIPILSQIDNRISQSHYASVLANKLDVPVEAIVEEMKKVKLGKRPSAATSIGKSDYEEKKGRRDILEERFLSLIFNNFPESLKEKKYKNLLKTSFGKRLVAELEKVRGSVKISEFVKILPPELKLKFSDLVLKGSESQDGEEKLGKELESIVREIRILDTKEKLEEVGRNIKNYEVLNKKRNLKKAEKRFSILTLKLSRLKAGK